MPKKSLGLKGLVEIINSHSITKAIINKIKKLDENSLVNGYVTITKNKGRKDEVIIQEDIKNLLTTSGRDFFHAQDYTNTAVGTKGSNAIALSANATDPTAGDTTLSGEIDDGGLERTQADTISHSVGTNVTTLQNLFIATAVFTDLHKSALFNVDTLAGGGQMTHASDFTSDVTLAIGDSLTVTWTLTLG